MDTAKWFLSRLKPSQLLILSTVLQLAYVFHISAITQYFLGIERTFPMWAGSKAMSNLSVLFEAIVGYSWVLAGSGSVLLMLTAIRSAFSQDSADIWQHSSDTASDLLGRGSSTAYYANTIHWVLFGQGLHISPFLFVPILLLILIWGVEFISPGSLSDPNYLNRHRYK